MGIVLLPVFLVMLLGFSYQGIRTGARAILRSQRRPAAVLVLIAMSIGLAAAEIVLPFALVASSRVSAGGFAVVVVSCVGGLAGWAGTCFGEQYRKTARPIHGLSSAAFFLAAGSFPIMWFWLAERMSTSFHVGWIY
jgi:hypothetical protein